jgi:two-component system LytT family response regulator
LLVDDERLARRGLELRLAAATDVEVVGECENGREAIARIASLAPDAVFLDIQMPGLTGLDVVAQLPQDAMPIIVFVTAYDRYAIDAFEARALDYLLKPVDDDRLAQTLERVRRAVKERDTLGRHERMLALLADVSGAGELDPETLLERVTGPNRRYPDMLTIRTGRDLLRIPCAEIDWIDAAGDYMRCSCGRRNPCLKGHDETTGIRTGSRGIPADSPFGHGQPQSCKKIKASLQRRVLPDPR